MKHKIVVCFERNEDDYALATENYPGLQLEAALKKELQDELEIALEEGILGGEFTIVSLTLIN